VDRAVAPAVDLVVVQPLSGVHAAAPAAARSDTAELMFNSRFLKNAIRFSKEHEGSMMPSQRS
jgi:hypothetical protein